MKLLSVGVIGYGVVGKRRINYIVKNKKFKLKFISDIVLIENWDFPVPGGPDTTEIGIFIFVAKPIDLLCS